MTESKSISGSRIPRVRRTDQVVEVIKGWVVRHDLETGDRLPRESELIAMLGCSRGTIREALKILEYQGIVRIVPGAGGGAQVGAVSYEHANEFLRHYFYFQPITWESVYQIREQLEPLVAEKAVGILSEDEIQALEKTVELCEDGVAGRIPPSEHRAAELEFHSVLARACPDPMLGFFAGFINDLLRDFAEHRNVIEPQNSEFAAAALRYHRQLLQAYKDKDAKRVRDLMSAHIHDARCIVNARDGQVSGDFLLQRNHG
ncbi:DNA-binding FadR family transcriptional regulator [Natronocella acetinitrilica]|uniref:DNA-binding FadR family transcriptional regulator n=1 Tax=Natronocella acetinitrilica TaxID=414046 RepID=A0AAE3G0F3_9GAMM|nr:FCD domain-containing protein [Natronocella acetinitrilica]MCP1673405.1 DNA-binding FadR family transcriptional regulator [Natronocella acetinitrilica]